MKYFHVILWKILLHLNINVQSSSVLCDCVFLVFSVWQSAELCNYVILLINWSFLIFASVLFKECIIALIIWPIGHYTYGRNGIDGKNIFHKCENELAVWSSCKDVFISIQTFDDKMWSSLWAIYAVYVFSETVIAEPAFHIINCIGIGNDWPPALEIFNVSNKNKYFHHTTIIRHMYAFKI